MEKLLPSTLADMAAAEQNDPVPQGEPPFAQPSTIMYRYCHGDESPAIPAVCSHSIESTLEKRC